MENRKYRLVSENKNCQTYEDYKHLLDKYNNLLDKYSNLFDKYEASLN